MNKEVIKVMQGKKQESNAREWWRKNGYKVWRVVLFPIWALALLKDKYNAWQSKRQTWSKERAAEILNYYIPRASKWDPNTKTFYFFDNGLGWYLRLAKRYLKWRDRTFWKVNAGSGGYMIRNYLIETFELEGFTKELGDCWQGWTEIFFTLNTDGLANNMQKFNFALKEKE